MVPVDEYVFSVYARGTPEFGVDLALGGNIRKSQRINARNAYQRVSVPFINQPVGFPTLPFGLPMNRQD